jgi:hypothetical protein
MLPRTRSPIPRAQVSLYADADLTREEMSLRFLPRRILANALSLVQNFALWGEDNQFSSYQICACLCFILKEGHAEVQRPIMAYRICT